MRRALEVLTSLFPVWVLLGAVVALVHPPAVTWFRGPFIVAGLAVIMLGMGITLSLEDFRRAAAMPRAVGAGLAAQYAVMPLLGAAVAWAFVLPTPLAVGVILVSCCPGGTASNVVSYLARANVALSVLMTMASTFAAVAMTPLLTGWLAGTLVPVDGWGLFRSTVQVVLLPVLTGIALHHATPRLVRAVLPVAPLVSVAAIALICASIIGQSADAFRASGARPVGAVFVLHAGGFGLGYAFARALGYDVSVARTMAIEVGMQNSGLGAVLARRHFADPLTALPAAISATFHSVIGSALAGWWRVRPSGQERTTVPVPGAVDSGPPRDLVSGGER
ncbi:MAG: bile acid:sodium symporter family protein [Myxococcota bacterium]|nr:bile acid:sodium symporter family protein [Myxococcota bacterium]